ncbi:MAG: cytochrome b/b6 domain-containing protein [Sphingomonadales bacterium]|nr:cytochrome b/b6 domain-containing protein [Sphingomonadales bacterium]MDE2570048.1 cytochrome b/b6 domain-containing protein [Sphingomonadales bacterium]
MKSFRIFHLLLATAVAVAYFTAEELGLVHAWVGYAVAALVALRLALGMARARGFEFRRLVPSLASPPRGQTGIRHPAIGRALTLALFLAIAGTATTGVLMDRGGTLVGRSIRAHDGERHLGARDEEREASASVFTLIAPSASAREEDERGEHEESALGEVHKTLGNLILPLVVAHLLYLLVFRFDLARFMLFVPRKPSAR